MLPRLDRRSVNASPAFWPGVIACATLVLVLLQLDPGGSYPSLPEGPGVTVDEIFNVEQGVFLVEGVRAYNLALLDPRSGLELFSNPAYLPDHPPVGRLWLGLHHHLARWMVPPADPDGLIVTACARTGSATAFALTVWLIGWTATVWWGRAAGAATALALVLMPRPFGHAHLAALETVTSLTCTAALVASVWAAQRREHVTCAALLAGVAAGLALLTKIQAILWMPLLAVLWATSIPRLGWRPALLWFAMTVGVFFFAWPWLWLDPVGHVLEYLGRTTNRAELSVWYFGRHYGDRSVPWHFPFVVFLGTTPLITLGMALLGVIRQRRPSAGSEWMLPREGVLMAAVLVPLIVFALPGVAVYDQERLFLIICPPVALLAGRGWRLLQDQWPVPITGRVGGLAAVGVAALLGVNQFSCSPCYLSGFGALAGGLPGAAASGQEVTYWGDSLTRELLAATARIVPEGESVVLAPVLHQFQVDDLVRQSPILRRRGLRVVAAGDADRPRWRLIYWRRADLSPELQSSPGNPRYEVRRQGVLLAGLYEVPAEPASR